MKSEWQRAPNVEAEGGHLGIHCTMLLGVLEFSIIKGSFFNVSKNLERGIGQLQEHEVESSRNWTW